MVASITLAGAACGGDASPPDGPGPSANLEVKPSAIDLGSLRLGRSVTSSVRMTNLGSRAISICLPSSTQSGCPTASSIEFSEQGFDWPQSDMRWSLDAHESTTFSVGLAPVTAGRISSRLRIGHNGDNETQEIVLSAEVLPPAVRFSTQSIDFGAVSAGHRVERTFEISNISDPLMELRIQFTSSSPSVFGVLAPDGSPIGPGSELVVPGGGRLAVRVAFMPTDVGAAEAILKVASCAGGCVDEIQLKGEATRPDIQIVPATEIDFGTHRTGETATRTLIVKSTGNEAVSVLGVDLSGPGRAQFSAARNVFPIQVAPGSSASIVLDHLSNAPGLDEATLSVSFGGMAPVSVGLIGDSVLLSYSEVRNDYGDPFGFELKVVSQKPVEVSNSVITPWATPDCVSSFQCSRDLEDRLVYVIRRSFDFYRYDFGGTGLDRAAWASFEIRFRRPDIGTIFTQAIGLPQYPSPVRAVLTENQDGYSLVVLNAGRNGETKNNVGIVEWTRFTCEPDYWNCSDLNAAYPGYVVQRITRTYDHYPPALRNTTVVTEYRNPDTGQSTALALPIR